MLVRASARHGEWVPCFAATAALDAGYRKGDLRGAIAAYEDSLTETHNVEIADKMKKVKVELKKKEETEYLDPVKSQGAFSAAFATSPFPAAPSLVAIPEARDRGNEAFKLGNFPLAIEEYSEAVKVRTRFCAWATNYTLV